MTERVDLNSSSLPGTLCTEKDADGVGSPFWVLLMAVSAELIALHLQQFKQPSAIAFTHDCLLHTRVVELLLEMVSHCGKAQSISGAHQCDKVACRVMFVWWFGWC